MGILVEFAPGYTPGLSALAAMERELEATIGRTVDPRTYHDLVSNTLALAMNTGALVRQDVTPLAHIMIGALRAASNRP